MVGFRSALGLMLCGAAAVLVVPERHRTEVDLGLVKTDHGISVMRHEVTRAQWRACLADGGCSHQPDTTAAAEAGDFPVTGIGVLDAQEFVAWAQAKIDPGLRLPTLAEWYAFSGFVPNNRERIFADPRLAWAANYGAAAKVDPTLRPSGSFGANAAGISDVRGNVWEWTGDCVVGMALDRCPAFYAAGEHEAKIPVFVRDPASGGCATGVPPTHLGFRLVKDHTSKPGH